MKLVKTSFIPLHKIDRERILKLLERAGRVCYKSEDKITPDSAAAFIKRIIKSGHTSVLEHEKISLLVTTNRGVSHGLVRHRAGTAFSQESTHYIDYTKDSQDNTVKILRPAYWEDKGEAEIFEVFLNAVKDAEYYYKKLIFLGARPAEARIVLPIGLKTEIVLTANITEWRHILKVRTADNCHPEMKCLMRMILNYFKDLLPELFGDIIYGNK